MYSQQLKHLTGMSLIAGGLRQANWMDSPYTPSSQARAV